MKLSVIMATYNETQQELSEAVESILTQTFSDFEFIIICDNPERSELLQWLEDLQKQDERIVLLINEKNIGLPLSLNRGIEIAQGEYIARMDADDISLPKRFEKQLKFIQREDADLVSTNRINMDEQGNIINHASPLPQGENIKTVLEYACVINHPTVMMRSEVVKDLQGYRLIQPVEDYDLWLRFLSSRKKIILLDEYLLMYRVRAHSISRSNRFQQILTHEYVVELYSFRVENSTEKDEFTQDHLNQFLHTNSYFNEKYKIRANKKIYLYENGITKLKKKNPMGAIDMGLAFLQEKWVRKEFFRLVKYKLSK